jgi:putative ABC transport system ATP-binding protein
MTIAAGPPSAREVIVKVTGVDKVYRTAHEKVYALKGINLEIYRGEYLSIRGPSGSGKSTLFNIIGALDRPTHGEVSVGGVSLPRLKSGELSYFRCRHIGYVFQNYNLIQSLTALENVMLPLTFIGEDDAKANARAVEVLEFVGLGDRLDHTPGQLSGGQQQRVAIARALANRPSILLADEPTANLDIKTGARVIEIFKELSTAHGVTIITATHDHKMFSVSDRIVTIELGQVALIKETKDMTITVGAIDAGPADAH